MYQEKLKRCGIVLIIVGILDISFMAWCNSHSQSYNPTFNIFSIIAGFFLIRGSLKAAKWTAYFGSFFLVMSIGGFLATCLAFPAAYTIASWKFQAHSMIYNMIMGIICYPLLYWICKELLSSDVVEAQKSAQIKPAYIKRPIIIGVIASLVLGVILFKATRDKNASHAVQLAEKKFGGAYNYQVTNMSITSSINPNGTSHKTVSAIVAAYNDSDFKRVPVSWKE